MGSINANCWTDSRPAVRMGSGRLGGSVAPHRLPGVLLLEGQLAEVGLGGRGDHLQLDLQWTPGVDRGRVLPGSQRAVLRARGRATRGPRAPRGPGPLPAHLTAGGR